MLLLLDGLARRADIPVVQGAPGPSQPYAPSIVSVGQASGYVIVGALQSPITGAFPVLFLNLYRAQYPAGPWTYIASGQVDPLALETVLIDTEPLPSLSYYAVSAVDNAGNESGMCAALFFTFVASPVVPGGAISSKALGPLPLLGSDIFISPLTGEGVVGPNGDFLTVNGLALLAQDLRTRILARRGAFLLHPEIGLTSASIGSGQARPAVQAQMLAADIQDAIAADPRVSQVLNVEVNEYDAYSWVVSYTVVAIGQEDPQRFNMVYPYYLAAA